MSHTIHILYRDVIYQILSNLNYDTLIRLGWSIKGDNVLNSIYNNVMDDSRNINFVITKLYWKYNLNNKKWINGLATKFANNPERLLYLFDKYYNIVEKYITPNVPYNLDKFINTFDDTTDVYFIPSMLPLSRNTDEYMTNDSVFINYPYRIIHYNDNVDKLFIEKYIGSNYSKYNKEYVREYEVANDITDLTGKNKETKNTFNTLNEAINYMISMGYTPLSFTELLFKIYDPDKSIKEMLELDIIV